LRVMSFEALVEGAVAEFCSKVVRDPDDAWRRWACGDGVRRRIVQASPLAVRRLAENAALVVVRVRAQAVAWQSIFTWMGGEVLLDVRSVTLYKFAEQAEGAWRIPDGSPSDEADRDRIDSLPRA
jgi:hypothetical protein